MDNFQWMVFIDLTTANYVGQKGVAVLSPVNDETNEIIANRVMLAKFDKLKINGVKYPKGTYAYMANCAVMPYLMYVLRKVMEYEGYTIKKNDLDKDPWNRLVINCRQKHSLLYDIRYIPGHRPCHGDQIELVVRRLLGHRLFGDYHRIRPLCRSDEPV